MYKLASHKIYLLAKMRNFLSNKAALTVYKSKVLPFFDYGDVLINNINSTLLTKLQRLQNNALRICLRSDRHTTTDDLHTQASTPRLKDRRLVHIRNLAHKRSLKQGYLDLRNLRTRNFDAPVMKTFNPK